MNNFLCCCLSCLCLALAACGGGGGEPESRDQDSVSIKVLSSSPNLVTAGEALVRVVMPTAESGDGVTVSLNGSDITSSFQTRENGEYEGLVKGLVVGENTFSVNVDGKTYTKNLINHPNGGPLLYGPQVQPWGCDPGAKDTQCNRPEQYTYKYVSTDPGVQGLQDYDLGNPPSNVAMITGPEGDQIPFVVRIETGVQNRDYYNIAVLYQIDKPWTRWKPQPTWNNKVIFMHGQGCGLGYSQYNGTSMSNVQYQYALSKGYAVASAALNDSGHNCNIVVQAESMVMLKQYIIKNYGSVFYAMGYGGSGGALAAQWLANAYPGIYDGIIVALSFPDGGSSSIEVEDCSLLLHYFSQTSLGWSDEQKAAVANHQTVQGVGDSVCNQWINVISYHESSMPDIGVSAQDQARASAYGVASTTFAGCDIPDDYLYDPITNPTGGRCTAQDYMSTVFGYRAQDGFANSYYSNSGVQYGLKALRAGVISPGQFVDLNARIGSHDINYNFTNARVSITERVASAAYRSGVVNSANGMSQVAIIDIRPGDTASIHHQYRSWSTRRRLDLANGTHANQAIWYNSGGLDEAIDTMDEWLSAVKEDKSNASLSEKIIENRLAAANDRCNGQDGSGLDMQQCIGGVDDGSPRMSAGGDIADDVLQCELKPMERSDYGVQFTEQQWQALRAVFPDGVCDYSKQGIGQQKTIPWQTYIDDSGRPIYGGTALSVSKQ